MNFIKLLPTLGVSAFLTVSAFAAEGWMTDFEAAKKKAAEEKKNLLVDFTGSDWCHWCKVIDKEIFSKPEFKGAENFVLVELDYPRDKSKQSEELQKQNEMLAEKYMIKGYPTIYLMTAEGKPFASTGYRQGGPEAYNKHLFELLEGKKTADAAFAKADAMPAGKEQAAAFEEALKAMQGIDPAYYPDILAKIKAADPDSKYLGILEIDKEMDGVDSKEKASEFVKKVDEFTAKHNMTGGTLQEFSARKINALLNTRQFAEAAPLIDSIIAISPESDLAARLKAFRDGRFKKMLDAKTKK
jgi:uncharacterized protein YyaL (SSP411 family)